MIKINGNKYEKQEYDGQELTMFYRKGLIVEDLKRGDIVRYYVETEDGQIGVVETHKVAKVVGSTVALVLLLVCVVFLVVFFVGKDNDTDIITEGMSRLEQLKNSVVSGNLKRTDYSISYNQYCTYANGEIDVCLINVDSESNVRVEGNGVESDIINCKPGEIVTSIKVNIGSEKDLPVKAIMYVTVDEKDYRCPIVINAYEGIPYSTLDKQTDDTDTEFKEIITK